MKYCRWPKYPSGLETSSIFSANGLLGNILFQLRFTTNQTARRAPVHILFFLSFALYFNVGKNTQLLYTTAWVTYVTSNPDLIVLCGKLSRNSTLDFMSMNIIWNKLSEKHKITASSILVGIAYILFYKLASVTRFDERSFLHMNINIWFNMAFYGFLFAWSEVWKKDYKKAVLHFVVGGTIFMFLNGITLLSPKSINPLYGYIFLLFPIVSFMILGKISLIKSKLITDKKLLLMVFVGGVLIKMLTSYLPYMALGDDFYLIGDLCKPPLFYFLIHRIMEARSWKELLESSYFSKQQFLAAYLIIWSTLLMSLYSLYESVRHLSSPYVIEDQFYFLFNQSTHIFYTALVILLLVHLCIQILTGFHRIIRKPLGWSYLLSFIPLVNFFALYFLQNYKSFVSNNVELWNTLMVSERKKIANGLIFLSLVGSCLSLFFSLPIRGDISIEGYLLVLMSVSISSLAIYAIFKGWVNFWAVVLSYAVMYSFILSMGGNTSIGFLTSSLIVRVLVLYIYYQAINPMANEELLQDVKYARDLQVRV